MYSVSKTFADYQKRRDLRPVIYFRFSNKFGARLWSDINPEPAEGYLETAPRVVNFGLLRESMLTFEEDVQLSAGVTEATTYQIVLDNSDGELSVVAARENILDATGELLVGFAGMAVADCLVRFKGRVVSYRTDRTTMLLELQGT